MARTASTMLDLGTRAPDFSLPEPATGKTLSLKDFSGQKALVVAFICNHCPFVIHIRKELAAVGKEYMARGAGFVAINANDVENYPDDSPEKMKKEVKTAGYTFPYLYDETQDTARAYNAACTPDFFVFDRDMKLVYRGQFDDSRPENEKPVNGKDLRAALDQVLAGKAPPKDQKPSLGCNIKWKPGNEPEYFG